MSAANIIERDGQTFVETDYTESPLGLGLQMPSIKPMSFRSLADGIALLSMDEIRELVSSSDFAFGRQWFDSNWITYQNGYGSCAAYAGASALEKAQFLSRGVRTPLSGDYLYSLVNGGRDRGSMLDDNMNAILINGVCRRETVKLGEIRRRSYDTRKADAEAKRNRGHELFAIPDEQSMATALAMRIPVVIAIHVTRRWRSFDRDDVLAECNGPGNHSEHCDDITYSRKRGCLMYRKATSHGKQYSGDGYCWTTWADHYRTASRYHQFYAVPSAKVDPDGDNPPTPDGDSRPSPSPEPSNDVMITMHTRSGCGWCDRWKNEVMPQVQGRGWIVEIQEGASGPVPRFTLSANGQTESKTGFWPFGDLAQTVARMQ
ncbi:MAG: C1 family peptidase [Planctomycetota bacterium]